MNYDYVLKPKNMLKQQGGDDTFEADNITATLKISRQELTDALRTMYDLTNADKFSTATNLVWYKFDPAKDKKTAEQMSMIAMLYRCELDGTIRPPVSLSDFYQQVNGLNNNTGTGLKPSL
jgi:hypothetical protein